MTTAFTMFNRPLPEFLFNFNEFAAKFEAMEEENGFSFTLDHDHAFVDRATRFVAVPVACFRGETFLADRRFFATFQFSEDFATAKFLDIEEFSPKTFTGPFSKTFFADFFRFPPTFRKSA